MQPGYSGTNVPAHLNPTQQARRKDITNRWLLSAPALFIVFIAAAGPLLVMLLYSFMVKGDYGDVKYWQFS